MKIYLIPFTAFTHFVIPVSTEIHFGNISFLHIELIRPCT